MRASVCNGAGNSVKLWTPLAVWSGLATTRRDGEPSGSATPQARTSMRLIGHPVGAAPRFACWSQQRGCPSVEPATNWTASRWGVSQTF